MDGIRSSLGGCLLAGNRACEFCHRERCRLWSPGAGTGRRQRPGCRDPGPARRGCPDLTPGRSTYWAIPGTKSKRWERGKLLPFAGILSLQWRFQLHLSRRGGGGEGIGGSCECSGRARLRVPEETAAARLPSCSRDSAALEFPHAGCLTWVGYVGGGSRHPTRLRATRVLRLPHPPPESQSQEVIDCLWRLGVQGSEGKRVQRMLSETVWVPSLGTSQSGLCLPDHWGLCQRKLWLPNPTMLQGARAWGQEGTWDRQVGQEGGVPESSITPRWVRQELLGITLKSPAFPPPPAPSRRPSAGP